MKGMPFSIEISDEAEGDLNNSYEYYFEEYTVKVIAIFHTSRNPEVWRERDEK